MEQYELSGEASLRLGTYGRGVSSLLHVESWVQTRFSVAGPALG